MQNEIWEPVKGYEGFYEASNLGRIKSLPRKVKHKIYGEMTVHGRIMKMRDDCHGYHALDLRGPNKERHNAKVYTLIAGAFLGEKPLGHIVDHIDGNRRNDYADNLQYITPRENVCKGLNCDLKKDKASKCRGVSWDEWNNGWVARIKKNGKSIFLGRYSNDAEAGRAYQHKLEEIENVIK